MAADNKKAALEAAMKNIEKRFGKNAGLIDFNA